MGQKCWRPLIKWCMKNINAVLPHANTTYLFNGSCWMYATVIHVIKVFLALLHFCITKLFIIFIVCSDSLFSQPDIAVFGSLFSAIYKHTPLFQYWWKIFARFTSFGFSLAWEYTYATSLDGADFKRYFSVHFAKPRSNEEQWWCWLIWTMHKMHNDGLWNKFGWKLNDIQITWNHNSVGCLLGQPFSHFTATNSVLH